MIVTLMDGRNCGYCITGMRLFFRKYNLDFRDFMKNGIEASVLLELNDSMANKVVEAAHGRKQ